MSLDDIKVGLVGHLAIGQTLSRSLADLLANDNKVKIYFVAPDVVKMKVGSLGMFYKRISLVQVYLKTAQSFSFFVALSLNCMTPIEFLSNIFHFIVVV